MINIKRKNDYKEEELQNVRMNVMKKIKIYER